MLKKLLATINSLEAVPDLYPEKVGGEVRCFITSICNIQHTTISLYFLKCQVATRQSDNLTQRFRRRQKIGARAGKA
jgi:hypothetical protein